MRRATSRIGITMREAPAAGYDEPRDALARDWGAWMARVLPEVAWLPIPNVGVGVADFVGRWQLDGLILSGGEDPGSAPARDATETRLLDMAELSGWPVFGVCRGAQLMWLRGGGRLEPVDGHVAISHPVCWTAHATALLGVAGKSRVRSFHRLGLAGASDAGEVCACAEDGGVEAFAHARLGRLGVLWHPERGEDERTEAAVRRLFGVPVRTTSTG